MGGGRKNSRRSPNRNSIVMLLDVENQDIKVYMYTYTFPRYNDDTVAHIDLITVHRTDSISVNIVSRTNAIYIGLYIVGLLTWDYVDPYSMVLYSVVFENFDRLKRHIA